jgi:hypothetical protein
VFPVAKRGGLNRWWTLPAAAVFVFVIATVTMFILRPPEQGFEAGPLLSPSPSPGVTIPSAVPSVTKPSTTKPKPTGCPPSSAMSDAVHVVVASYRVAVSQGSDQTSPSPSPSTSPTPTPSPSPSPTETSGPSISLVMTANPDGGSPGQQVTIQYLVRNTGTVTLFDVTVVDDRLGPFDPIPTLDPEQEFQVTRATTLDSKSSKYHATVTGEDDQGNVVAFDEASVGLTVVLHGQVQPPPKVLGVTGC